MAAAVLIPAELSAHLQGLPAKADVRFASLSDWAMVRVMDELIDKIGVDNIVLAAQSAYDEYVAPFDIPGVPNHMEPALIDQPAKMLLALLIRGFHDLVHNKPGPLMKGAMAQRTWVGEAA